MCWQIFVSLLGVSIDVAPDNRSRRYNLEDLEDVDIFGEGLPPPDIKKVGSRIELEDIETTIGDERLNLERRGVKEV